VFYAYLHLTCSIDEESRRADRLLEVNKKLAGRGIIKWEFIRSYLDRRNYEPKIVEVVRAILERFNVIIPIRTEHSGSADAPPSAMTTAFPTPLLRQYTDPGVIPILPFTPVRPRSRAFTSASSGFTMSLCTPSTPQYERLCGDGTASDQQYYLVPSLLPQYRDEPIAQLSGFITLERTFHFNRFTPPGLVQAIFARIYTLQEGQEQPLTDAEGTFNNVCWDRAFAQRHGVVRVLVVLMPVSDSGVGLTASEGGNQDLHIRGTGHTLNAHAILEQLDKYTTVTQQILAEYPGLGHVRLSSTCPDCLITQTVEGKRGEFRHSELVALQETFQELTDLLQSTNNGRISNEVRAQLRKWNSKRHTCPKFRAHQIKSEMLIHVPRMLKAEIERASHAEKEINFLLDEVVRSAAVPLRDVAKGVVKVMAANCQQHSLEQAKHTLQELKFGETRKGALTITAIQYSSGAVVPVPEGHQLANVPSLDRTNEVVVLSCEHVVTEANFKDGRVRYANKGERWKDTIFLIGGRWLTRLLTSCPAVVYWCCSYLL
jgi:hypothetical protein